MTHLEVAYLNHTITYRLILYKDKKKGVYTPFFNCISLYKKTISVGNIRYSNKLL